MMNSCRKMPPRLFLGEDCRRVFPYQEGILLPDEDGQQTLIHPGNRREGHRGYLVTTTGRVNGAVAFFYPGVKDILAEKMGGDYYVAFPSVHEAIIHPGALYQCPGDPHLRPTHQCRLRRRRDAVGPDLPAITRTEDFCNYCKMACNGRTYSLYYYISLERQWRI